LDEGQEKSLGKSSKRLLTLRGTTRRSTRASNEPPRSQERNGGPAKDSLAWQESRRRGKGTKRLPVKNLFKDHKRDKTVKVLAEGKDKKKAIPTKGKFRRENGGKFQGENSPLERAKGRARVVLGYVFKDLKG